MPCERRIKEDGLTGDAVVELRQREALPVLQTLKDWMQREYAKLVVKKRPIAQAIHLYHGRPIVYSLLATCKLHIIHPYYWLRDVLEHMHHFTTSTIEKLLPQNWKKLPAM